MNGDGHPRWGHGHRLSLDKRSCDFRPLSYRSFGLKYRVPHGVAVGLALPCILHFICPRALKG